MGKKGDALRAAKKKATTYTFTREQLEARDEEMKREWRESFEKESRRVVAKLMKERAQEAQKEIEAEWQKRAEEFHTGDREEDFYALLQYMLAIPVRILVERFGWRPAANGSDGRFRLVKFADYVIEELERISGDDLMDIRKYSEQTAEMYGVQFKRG